MNHNNAYFWRTAVLCVVLAAVLATAAEARPTELPIDAVDSVPCFFCETAVEALRYLYERNTTQNTILRVAVHICEHYANNETLICQGLVSQFQDSFLYVLEELALRPSQLCGLILPNCGVFHNPFDSNWTISLPEPADQSQWSSNPSEDLVKINDFDGKSNYIDATLSSKRPVNSAPIFPKANLGGKPQFQVLQLSDLHYDPLYESGSEADCAQPICCQHQSSSTPNGSPPNEREPPLQLAGYWGSIAKCDLPYRTIHNMLQHINETHQVDYVLLTGDLISHSDWTYTKQDHREVIRTLNASLNALLPGVPVFWAIGNHEGVPINSFAPHFAPQRFRPDWLYQEVTSAARRWMPEEQLPEALYRGSYSVMLTDRLKLISVNSGYCESTNFFLYINQTDPDGALSWLVEELYGCEMTGYQAHIIAHIPPGDSECLEGWARNYYRIVNRFSGTIRAQFFGHVHTDSFTVFYQQMNDSSSTPTGVLYSTPSVTTFDYLNPAYRIYTIDTVTNEVLDFTTYFLNITAIEDLPHWEPLYSAKNEYGMKDLSPASWNELANRIDTNATVYQRFVRNYARRVDYECDDLCRAELLCALRRGHHDDRLCACDEPRRRRQRNSEARLRHGFSARSLPQGGPGEMEARLQFQNAWRRITQRRRQRAARRRN